MFDSLVLIGCGYRAHNMSITGCAYSQKAQLLVTCSADSEGNDLFTPKVKETSLRLDSKYFCSTIYTKESEVAFSLHQRVLYPNTVKPVIRDHPFCHRKVVFQGRWPLNSGSIHKKIRHWCIRIVVLHERCSLNSGVSDDRLY